MLSIYIKQQIIHPEQTLGVVLAGSGGEVDDVVDVGVGGQLVHQVNSNEALAAPTWTN